MAGASSSSVDIHGEEYADLWNNHLNILDGVAVTMNCNVVKNERNAEEDDVALVDCLPKLISDLCRYNSKVDIICLQECPGSRYDANGTGSHWLENTLKMLKEVSKDTWDRVGDKTDTGAVFQAILYNATKYEKDIVLSSPGKTEKFRISVDNCEVKRHEFCALYPKGQPLHVFGVLSFHGVENDTKYGGKYARERKQEILKAYLGKLSRHVVSSKIPLLIGGDWNIEVDKNIIGKCTNSMGRLWMPQHVDTCCVRKVQQKQKNRIDYFVSIEGWSLRKGHLVTLNVSGLVEAASHVDFMRARKMDHDPVFLPYRLFTLNCHGLGLRKTKVPPFPRKLASRYLQMVAHRLVQEVDHVFPSRCFSYPPRICTWGQLLEMGKDEVFLRYYLRDLDGKYLEGSEISSQESESDLSETIANNSYDMPRPVLGTDLEKKMVHYLVEMQGDRTKDIKNTKLTKKNFRKLDKGERFLRREIFPNLFGYKDFIATQKEAVDVCYEIFRGNDRIGHQRWSIQEMNDFIDKKLLEIRGKIEGKISTALQNSPEKTETLLDVVKKMLGYEIQDNELVQKQISQKNLKYLRKNQIISAFKYTKVPGGFSNVSKHTLCEQILRMKSESQQCLTPQNRSDPRSIIDFNDTVNSDVRTGPVHVPLTLQESEASTSGTSRFVPELSAKDKRIIMDGIIRIHIEIQNRLGRRKGVTDASLKSLKDCLWDEAQKAQNGNEAQSSLTPNQFKNAALFEILGEDLSIESNIFKQYRGNSRKYAAVPYIMNYLMVVVKQVDNDTRNGILRMTPDEPRRRIEFQIS